MSAPEEKQAIYIPISHKCDLLSSSADIIHMIRQSMKASEYFVAKKKLFFSIAFVIRII